LSGISVPKGLKTKIEKKLTKKNLDDFVFKSRDASVRFGPITIRNNRNYVKGTGDTLSV
jgi:hypothetical protein